METRMPGPARWPRFVDALIEGLLISFVAFTVVYMVAAPLGWPAWPLGYLAIGLTVLIVALCLLRVRRAAPVDAPGDLAAALAEPARRRGRQTLLTALLALSAAAVVLSIVVPASAFWAFWVVALCAAVAGAAWALRSAGAPASRVSAPGREHLGALLLAVVMAGFVLFVVNPSSDDIYYVNKSVWVAQHGTFPLRDTLFAPLKFPTTYPEAFPVVSLEPLLGTLAHALGLSAGTFIYLVVNPATVFIGVWVLWRLVEQWAPRRRLLVLLVGVVAPLWLTDGIAGKFGWARSWEGKVIAELVIVPLIWLHFTRLGRQDPGGRTHRWSVVMLGVLGAAWCGLTVTGPLLAPGFIAVAVVAAVVIRQCRRSLLLGAAALAIAPLAVGIATALTIGKQATLEHTATSPLSTWHKAMGFFDGPLAVVVIALLFAPALLRAGLPRIFAALAVVEAFLVLTPGVVPLFQTVTSAGPVAPRLLLVAPLPLLLGMIAAVPSPEPLLARKGLRTVGRYAGPVLAAVLVAVLVLSGRPPWRFRPDAALVTHPAWKVGASFLKSVEAVDHVIKPGGTVLLPSQDMNVVPIYTSRWFAVVPWGFYAGHLHEPHADRELRRVLARFSQLRRSPPSTSSMQKALDGLRVQVACTSEHSHTRIRILADTGYLGPRKADNLVCFERPH